MVKNWIQAMRLRTLPLAASGIIAGSAGLQDSPKFGLIFSLALLTALALQVFSNLANDYGDFKNGADNEHRIGPPRAVQAGLISVESMKRGLYFSGAIAFILGLALLVVAFLLRGDWLNFFLYLALGVASLVFAFTYTAGKNPYGYKGMGDVAVFLFFGVVSVISMPLLLTGEFTIQSLFATLIVGSLSTAVLHLNNMRDHENDRKSGKHTVVVRLGFARGKYLHFVWLALAFLGALFSLFHNFAQIAWYLAPFVVLVIHAKRVYLCENPRALDKELKIVALSTFLIALLLFISLAA